MSPQTCCSGLRGSGSDFGGPGPERRHLPSTGDRAPGVPRADACEEEGSAGARGGLKDAERFAAWTGWELAGQRHHGDPRGGRHPLLGTGPGFWG